MEIVDPARKFMVNGQVALLSDAFSDVAVGTTALLGADTGYTYRIMGLMLQGTTAVQGTVVIKGSGGAALMATITAPPNTGLPFVLPVIDSGYTQSIVGEGLSVTVGGAVVAVNIFYLKYKP